MLAESKNSRTFASLLKTSTLEKRFGEMAEWSIAAVLKTVVLRGTGGSNPSLSARKRQIKYSNLFEGFLSAFFYIPTPLQKRKSKQMLIFVPQY